MPKRGEIKPGAKYKSRKKVGNRWIYVYDDENKKNLKPRIENYYGKYRHKYFNTEQEKKDFLGKNGNQNIQTSKIKRTVGRLTKNTKVKFTFNGIQHIGKIISSNGTPSKSPTLFSIEYIDADKKTRIAKNVKRENVSRQEEAWSEKGWGRLHTEKKKEEKKKVIMTEVHPELTNKAKQIVMQDWKTFSRIVSSYYKKRALGGWDASKMGFDEEDLQQEAFIILQNAANAYLKNNLENKIPFVKYTKAFLKANLAAKLAAGSGNGGHVKMSAKDQLYFMFFKKVVDEYKTKNGKYPSDVVLLKLLENEREKLTENKGNITIKDYKWNLDKIQNKKALYKRTISLNMMVDSTGDSDTQLIDILEGDETYGHFYKVDPWEEVQKKWIRESVKDAMERLFQSKEDVDILTRYYGLFVDEKSPKQEREYAEGQSLNDISKYLNNRERAKGSLKRWNSELVNERVVKLLGKLKSDKEFVRKVYGMEKAEQKKEWSDAQLILWWIGIYNTISESIDYFISDDIEGYKSNIDEMQGEESLINPSDAEKRFKKMTRKA